MSSVGCLRNQWCFNKSLALGRLISFLLRHKLTNSASSFEKIFSGTLGACDHAVHSQACSAAPQGTAGAPQGHRRGAAGVPQGCCRGAVGVLQGCRRGAAGVLQGCCKGAAGVLHGVPQLRWASGAHAEGVHEPGYVCVARYPLADNELGLGLGLGEGWGEGEGTSSSMMSESSRK